MKKSINHIYAAACIIIALSSSSAIQAQEYIDEDLLPELTANASHMLVNPPKEFKTTTTPAKWDKESAVIIGLSRDVTLDKKNSGGFFSSRQRTLFFIEKMRLSIKLLDKAAVNSFSEIYFQYGSREDGFIARVIKPGDTATTLDLKSAVSVKNTDVPDIFRSFMLQVSNGGSPYYKVPVSNLEPGDILEFVSCTRSKKDVTYSGYVEFMPMYEICSKKYPLMFNELAIETDGKTFFNSLSLNGAPAFKKEASQESGFFRYVFADRDRGREKDVNFISPLLQYPIVKFQVIYSNDENAKGALIGEKGELKTRFTKEELALKAWEDYEGLGKETINGDYYVTYQYLMNSYWAELVKLGAKKWSTEQFIENAYYFLRNKILYQREYLSDKAFSYIFGSLLFQRDIKSEVVISTSNNISKFSEILFDNEIRYALKIGDKLYFNSTDFSNPGEKIESLIDNEAYIITQPHKKTKAQEIKPFKLPGTSFEENTTTIVFNAELDAAMEKMKISRTSSYTGIQKAKNSYESLMYTPYLMDDYKNFEGKVPGATLKGKALDDFNKTQTETKEEYQKQKKEIVKKSLQGEYSQRVENVKFNLINDGRSKDKPVLSFKEEFELSDMVRLSGKKYLVNVTGLVGSQLQIRKAERERTHDIDVRSPRSLNWTINFKIPAGYKAEGLEELKTRIENETGIFHVEAKEENGNIVIDIKKIYKSKLIPKDKWKDMLAFVDAAYNSTYKYILLTPKS